MELCEELDIDPESVSFSSLFDDSSCLGCGIVLPCIGFRIQDDWGMGKGSVRFGLVKHARKVSPHARDCALELT